MAVGAAQGALCSGERAGLDVRHTEWGILGSPIQLVGVDPQLQADGGNDIPCLRSVGRRPVRKVMVDPQIGAQTVYEVVIEIRRMIGRVRQGRSTNHSPILTALQLRCRSLARKPVRPLGMSRTREALSDSRLLATRMSADRKAHYQS
jgi:hypothetical protein